MNAGQRQVIAEKIASTVRVLELLGFNYLVTRPKNERRKGNRSPRVVYVYAGNDYRPEDLRLRIYNSASGSTWANKADSSPIGEVHSVEDLHDYLKRRLFLRLRRLTRTR